VVVALLGLIFAMKLSDKGMIFVSFMTFELEEEAIYRPTLRL
jgi:hypothetical protein